jgi:uncharacterized protein YabE (DUF348 family)
MQQFRNYIGRAKQAHIKRFKRWRKHPFGLPIAVFVGLLFASGLLFFILSFTHNTTFHPDTTYIAIISHDNGKQIIPTREPTVGALLKKLNIPVSVHDRVEPSLTTPIAQDNLRINIYRAVPVTIVDGSTITTTFSAGATPRSIVAGAGMVLYSEDGVTAQPAVNLVAEQSLGKTITINRSVPITLNVYGVLLQIRTHAKTVSALLKAHNVTLKAADTVIPVASTPITSNLQVFVNRKGTEIVTVTQAIASPQQIVTDNSLSFGTSATRQQGSTGTQVLTYQINKVNGVEVSRSLLQSVVTVQPVATIVARGQAVSIPADKQAVMAQAGIAAGDYKYVDYVASHEGGWCPTKIQGRHDCPQYMSAGDVPASGGYGIFQATPGRKMASAGGDWVTSAATQIRWATGYATGRYGSWEGAYNHWVSSHNW